MLDLVQSWREQREPASIRERITDVNDGIIAVSGMGLGLVGAEVSATTAYAVVCISAVVGALSVFGVKVGEGLAEREAQQATVAEERRLLELTPDEEVAELAAWFEAKGVTATTARQVAEELSAADALSAQLEVEYGIRDLTSTQDAWLEGMWAGLAFLLGSIMPLLITILTPMTARVSWIAGIAVLSLAITSLVLSRRGRSNVVATMLRSVVLGVGTLAISYLLGDWLV